jgi:transposase
MSRKKAELDKARVTALYEDGNTTEQISKVFDVTAPTIRKFMQKHGIEMRKSRGFLTNEQKEQASSMRASGMTLKQTAEAFNISMSCIRSNLVNHQNRVESLLTETPSHTTVQAMSHTAVLLLCLPKANERLKSPNLLNHSRFIALCTI